ncbi:MAG: MucR family transcriptional regulator, partial [Caulobacteraceae bacterium]
PHGMEAGRSGFCRRLRANRDGLSGRTTRAKWGLPRDYPMVAAAYSEQRSNLARALGLGRKAKALDPAKPAAPKAGRGKAPAAKRGKAIKPSEDTFT